MTRHLRHPSYGSLGLLEILLLGPVAAFLVVRFIPSLFGADWDCVGAYGRQRVAGDTYLAGMVVMGTFGWLLVAVGVLFAQIAESEKLAALLPLVWFLPPPRSQLTRDLGRDGVGPLPELIVGFRGDMSRGSPSAAAAAANTFESSRSYERSNSTAPFSSRTT